MKVMLVYPLADQKRSSLNQGAWAPLGLSFIASSLREAGHAVAVCDRYASQALPGAGKDEINAAMLERIRDFKPDLIGFNTVSPLIYDTVECIRLIRPLYTGILVAGGHHASALPELTLKRIPELSGVVEGEGEEVMVKLAGGCDPLKIPGLWWRKGEEILNSPPEQIKNLDLLPLPALDLLDMGFYCRPGRKIIRGHYLSAVSLLTSRGCSRRCSYCAESLTYGGGVRFHSPEYVLGWIREAVEGLDVEGIYFHDNDFLIDQERAAKICEGILSAGKARGLKFAVQTRADRINKGILKTLKKAGCVVIELGVESAVQGELDWMKKGSTVDISERAVALCREAGISVHAYIMSGLKGETLSDLDDKLDWLRKSRPDTFSWHNLQIFPGTLLYLEEGMDFFEKNDWSEENVKDYFRRDFLSSIPAKERREWMQKKYSPFKTRSWRLNVLRVNSPSRLLSVLKSMIADSSSRFFRDK